MAVLAQPSPQDPGYGATHPTPCAPNATPMPVEPTALTRARLAGDRSSGNSLRIAAVYDGRRLGNEAAATPTTAATDQDTGQQQQGTATDRFHRYCSV